MRTKTPALLLEISALGLIFALATSSFAWKNLVLGFLLGMILLGIYGPTLHPEQVRIHWFRGILPFLNFILFILWDILRGAWKVTLISLRLQSVSRPGILRIRYEHLNPAGAILASVAFTLSPGSVLVDLDLKQNVLYFHLIDLPDPEMERNRYEQALRKMSQFLSS